MKRFEISTGRVDATYGDPEGQELLAPSQIAALPTPDGGAILAEATTTKNARGTWIWDANSGKLLGTVASLPYGIFVTALSPDGRILAAGGEVSLGLRGLFKKDYAIRLWEVASGREIGRLEGLADATITLAFSPDSRMLASAGATGRKGKPDHSLHLWDLTTLRELRRFDGHRNHINRVAISPDGRWLASASEDATVLVWDLARVDVPEVARPSKGDLDRLWTELAGDDAARAYRATWSLAAIPDSAVPLLAERLRPVEKAGPEEQEWPLRSGQVLRQLRAIGVLEKIARPGASECWDGYPRAPRIPASRARRGRL